MPSLITRFRLPRSARLATLRATVRLLYTCHPRAFITSSIASLFEPLYFPVLLLLLHQLLQEVIGSGGSLHFTSTVAFVGLGLVILILVQRLGIILRDSSSTILRQQAWVVISKRIMQKLPAVPYPLFENNAFQARYGLVIREASQRSITLVDSLLSTAPILLGLLGLAATLFVLAPLLVLVMVVISIPASRVERRFSRAMYDLQEHNAPNQLRMEALTNMQVDASWQRDVRVYHSDIIPREHAWLADDRRAEYFAISDAAALDAARLLSRSEGIIPALESAHALAGLVERLPTLNKEYLVILNLSGRGDKDMETYSRLL